MSSARFQVSGPAIRKSGIVFQQGQRLTRFSRESGQVRRKQTRRGLRFLSLTLAISYAAVIASARPETLRKCLFPLE